MPRLLPPCRLLVAGALALLARGVRADDPPTPPEPPVSPRPRSPEAARPAPAQGRIGFSPAAADTLSPEQRAAIGIASDAKGLFLVIVVPGSPADLAGLKPGDRLVSIGGRAVPAVDARGVVPDWQEGFKKLVASVRTGDEVTVVVERAGESLTVKAVAVDAHTIDQLRELASGDRSIEQAGPPVAFTETFESPVGTLAHPNLSPVGGRWTLAEKGNRPGLVLRQSLAVDPWALALFPGPGRALADGTVTVSFRPVSGREDASGGIVFRARDAKNYYLVRANALEGNFRLYSVKDGNRWQIAGVDADPPALGTWHDLSVTFHGKEIKASLDGKVTLQAKDDLFLTPGWVGLWTKADSVTEFDNLEVTPEESPAPAKGPPEPAPKPTK